MTVDPKFRNLTSEILKSLHNGERSDQVVWQEALLRYCEINIHRLSQINQLGGLFLKTFHDSDDLRFLNISLKLADAGLMDRAVVRNGLEETRRHIASSLSPSCEPRAESVLGRAPEGTRVVLLSPSPYSLYTLSVAGMLRAAGFDIEAVAVRRLADPRRFISEFRRDGSRLIKKIWRKAVLKESAYGGEGFETIVGLKHRIGIPEKHVRDFGVPIISCRSFDEPQVLNAMDRANPDLVIYTGGGMVRSPVLERAGRGVLNCHMGILPAYRGMDVVEWPVLLGDAERVGLTCHLMDKGLDTGPILRTTRLPPRPGEDFLTLRKRFEPLMCREIVECAVALSAHNLDPQPQAIEDGKQYYVMHAALMDLARDRLRGLTARSQS